MQEGVGEKYAQPELTGEEIQLVNDYRRFAGRRLEQLGIRASIIFHEDHEEKWSTLQKNLRTARDLLLRDHPERLPIFLLFEQLLEGRFFFLQRETYRAWAQFWLKWPEYDGSEERETAALLEGEDAVEENFRDRLQDDIDAIVFLNPDNVVSILRNSLPSDVLSMIESLFRP